ncbi:MAG: PEGA domain-containing protein [Bacteroidetes bacterium]|nr:PEGA domain-containing protein [Bacteroidota bacterium]
MYKIILAVYFISFAIYGQNYSKLNINTNQESALIYINEKLVGQKEAQISLEAGTYKILIVERDRGWNAQSINDTITISSSSKIFDRTYRFKNSVLLKTNPQNVYIYHNDSLYAFSPAKLDVSLNTVMLLKTNFRSKFVELADLKPEIPVALEFTGTNKKEHFVDSPWFTVFLGSTVLFGATAVYFKIQADQKYDRYTISMDRNLLKDIDRYDLYSGIAFGLLQFNFGYLIYEFLFESP